MLLTAGGHLQMYRSGEEGQNEPLLATPLLFYEELVRDLGSSRDARSRRLLADGRLGLSRVYALLGRIADAKRELEQAVTLYDSLDPAHSAAFARAPKVADARVGLARALWERGKPEQAVAEFREAVRLQPLAAWIRYDLGMVLRDRGDASRRSSNSARPSASTATMSARPHSRSA